MRQDGWAEKRSTDGEDGATGLAVPAG
jgi:hypothetical protein